MNRNKKEHELMARKLWCDVYVELIKDNDPCVAEGFANGAYQRFKKNFSQMVDNYNLNDK